MHSFEKFNKIAENLAVSFKIASSAASVFEEDSIVSELQNKASGSSYRPRFSLLNLRSWLAWQKKRIDESIDRDFTNKLIKNRNK